MKRYIKISVETIIFHFYLFLFLEVAACTGSFAYKLLDSTGHRFRSREIYASIFAKGVLKKAEKNLKNSKLFPVSSIKDIVKSYLRFESRFALENIWIRKNSERRIKGAFNTKDLENLKGLLDGGQFVIATPHNVSLYMLVALIHSLGHGAAFMVMNPLANKIDHPTPLHKSLFKLFPKWGGFQDFVFIQDGDVFKRSVNVLNSAKSLIIAPDVPSSSENKVQIDFMGKKTLVSAGTAVLAQRCQVPILVVVPWADSCSEPYHLAVNIVESPQDNDISQCMGDIFTHFQTGIARNPACWSGWLYWDAMDHI